MFMRRIATFLLFSVILCLTGQNRPALAADRIRILAFGDSLTAGWGVSEAENFPTQLSAALQKMGRDVQVINGGVSGDTTAGGLARLDWSLSDAPNLMLLELGGNDMLRGVLPNITKSNLEQIITRAQKDKVTVMLIGMKAAPNLGSDYRSQFDAIYPDLAKSHNLVFYPFMMDGVIGDPSLMQADGIHPNPHGVAVIVDKILPDVIQALGKPAS